MLSQSLSPTRSAGHLRSEVFSPISSYLTPRPQKIVKKSLLQKKRPSQVKFDGAQQHTPIRRKAPLKERQPSNSRNSQGRKMQKSGSPKHQGQTLSINTGSDAAKNLGHILKFATTKNQNSNALAFQPFVENNSIRKLTLVSKKSEDQNKKLKREGKSTKVSKKNLPITTHVKGNDFRSHKSSNSVEGYYHQTNEPTDRALINFESPYAKKSIQHTKTQPGKAKHSKIKVGSTNSGINLRSNYDHSESPKVSQVVGPGEKLIMSVNRALSNSKNMRTRESIDSRKDSSTNFQEHLIEVEAPIISQREQSKESNSSQKKQQKNQERTNSAFNTNSIRSMYSSDPHSYRHHQMKVQNSKHFKSTQIQIKNPQNMQQQPVTSPIKTLQSKNQQFLQNVANKQYFTSQSTYFQSAKLLNKGRGSSNQKSRNQNLVLLGGTQPLIQNWQTQLGSGFSEIMQSCQSVKNFQSNQPGKNKTQSKITSISQAQLTPATIQEHNATNQNKYKDMKLPSSQQLQAAIIKNSIMANQKKSNINNNPTQKAKPVIQNNFQVSFTNSFNNHNLQSQQQAQPIEEELSEILNNPSQKHSSKQSIANLFEQVIQLDQKLNDLLQEIEDQEQPSRDNEIINQTAEAHMKILDELSQKDNMYRPIMLRIKKGVKDSIKDYDMLLEQQKQKCKEQELSSKELQLEIKRLTQELNDVQRNELESRTQMQNMAGVLDERDNEIERLEIELDEQKRKNRQLFKAQMQQPGGKRPAIMQDDHDFDSMTDPALAEQLNELGQENQELKAVIQEMQEELDYGKQRENKLMFFLFILKEKGYPISEVFEEEIKDIPTTRFSTHFDDEYKQMYYQLKQERKQKKKLEKEEKDGEFGVDRDQINSPFTERVFTYAQNKPDVDVTTASHQGREKVPYISQIDLSDSQLVPVTLERAKSNNRPQFVPKLDIAKVPQYSSDSSQFSEESQSKAKRGPNPRQMKKILDKYNIHTCARNLIYQEKAILKRREELRNDKPSQKSLRNLDYEDIKHEEQQAKVKRGSKYAQHQQQQIFGRKRNSQNNQ